MIQWMLVIWSLVPLPFLNPRLFLNIWKFTVHVLLKPGLENFEHHFASVKWVQLHSSLNIFWHWLSLGLEWKQTFSSPVATAEFSKFADIECSTFTAASFRIWNNSIGIPSPQLALFIVMLPKAHLTSRSRMSGSRWVITPCDYLGHEDLFCIVLLCIFATSS